MREQATHESGFGDDTPGKALKPLPVLLIFGMAWLPLLFLASPKGFCHIFVSCFPKKASPMGQAPLTRACSSVTCLSRYCSTAHVLYIKACTEIPLYAELDMPGRDLRRHLAHMNPTELLRTFSCGCSTHGGMEPFWCMGRKENHHT